MNELAELLENLDIESWLDAQGIDYKRTRGRSGVQLNVKICPVCGNSDHKVYLNAETGAGNCFAGSHPPGENFSKYKFIRAHLDGASGNKVLAHIRHYVESTGWRPKRSKSVAVQKAIDLVIPDSYPLPFDGKNLTYLTKRGIPSEIAAYFHLRYCHKGFFPYELDGEKKYMPFHERIIIPVFDLDGKMVTFQGRDITGTAPKKYMFPPGLPSSGTHLLNGQNVRDTERVLVVEGAFDLMAVKIALDADPSLRDVVPVATFGKHLSYGDPESQEGRFMKLKERGVKEVTIMWDGEIAATDDAIDAGKRLAALGFSVRIAMLPKEKDPNEVPASVVRDAFYKAIGLTMQSSILIAMRRRQMNAI